MEKSKGSPLMLVIIALLVLLLATIVAVTFYLVSAFGGNGEEDDAPRIVPSKILLPHEIDWSRELEEITTNLLNPPPNRNSAFVITTILVGIDTTVPSRDLNAFNVQYSPQVARTIANEVFFGTPYDEARTPEGRAAIEGRILDRLQIEYGPIVVGIRTPGWVIP
jgi:flagellar basal body-associated protein FliL